MNDQSKQMVANAIVRVVNSAPRPQFQPQINNTYMQMPQSYDISMQEFNTWINYANQILDISYNHIKYDAIFSAKTMIYQIASQYGIPNIQRIEQIKNILLNLVQTILYY